LELKSEKIDNRNQTPVARRVLYWYLVSLATGYCPNGVRDTLNTSPLELIKETEKKAEKNLIKAQESGEKMITEAKKQRQKAIANAEKDNLKIKEKFFSKAREEAKKEIDELMKQEATEKQRIIRLASKNKEKAILLVMEEILK